MIDFHCHLDLYPDPRAAAERASQAGVYVLSVTTTPKAWQGTAMLAQGLPRVRTALGLHPQLAHERHAEMALFEGLLGQTRYVGEVGLDGSPELKPHAGVQRRIFDRVLWACAKAGGRVISIHSRRAADDVLDALARRPDAGVPVLHWFSGTARQLERAVAMGCWFSVGPAMLSSPKGLALVGAMPRERILTETDGPFGIARGRPLEPGDVVLAEVELAKVWRCGTDEVRGHLFNTFRNLARTTSGFGGPPVKAS